MARARPDGYTLLFGTGAELVINPVTRKAAPYDLLRDFVPITEVGSVGFVLAVPGASAARNVPDLVAAAKAQPGKLNYASFGMGSTNHLIGELFLHATGTRATMSRSGQPAGDGFAAGGRCGFHLRYRRRGAAPPEGRQARALATPSPRRLPSLPDVPTLQELGHGAVVAEGWMGVFAPAGTPADIVKTLAAALDKVVRTPDMQARLDARGVAASAADGAQFTRKLQAELEKWRRVARQADVSLD